MTTLRARLISLVLVAVLVFPNLGRTQENIFSHPEFTAVDARGVELVSGRSTFVESPVSIGGEKGLVHTYYANSNRFDLAEMSHNYDGSFHNADPNIIVNGLIFPGATGAYTVRLGQKAAVFIEYSSSYGSMRDNGETLVSTGVGEHLWTWGDGTEVIFTGGRPSKVTYPNGFVVNIHRQSGSSLIRSVTSNTGYQLKFSYDGSNRVSKVVALNRTVDFCDPVAVTCSYSRVWPEANFSYTTVNGALRLTVTDMAGGETRYTQIQKTLGAAVFEMVEDVRYPTSLGADNVEYEYAHMWVCTAGYGGLPGSCSFTRNNLVYRVHVGSATWSYDHTPAPPYNYESKSTNPNGKILRVVYNKDDGNFVFITKPDGSRADFGGFPNNRVIKVTYPEGNETHYSYDTRGNITEERRKSKPSSSLADLVRTANYDSSCSNRKTCNKPNWVRDARQNQTDYDYHQPSGQVSSVTKPPNNDGVRAQTRYEYQQRYAYIKNSSGNYVSTGEPIWMLSEESYCRTSAATSSGCTQSNDEVIIGYDYGPVGSANNLSLRGMVVTAEGQSLRTCYAYDDLGNRISETLPKAALSSCP